ncbi:MAG TPA: 3-hydroxyacyl-CoA dehydrogenase family protein [Bordetella sp.]|nr:3-hydroxyacyl-CoA dehydrogenase family protein [Bordetella sp.]
MSTATDAVDLVAGGTLGIVGNVSMTAGIAQVAALAGWPVKLYGSDPQAVADNLAFARRMIARQVEKGTLDGAAGCAASEAIQTVAELAELRGCAIVIESMLGNLAQTQACVAELEDVLDVQAVIALNTSSTPVTVLSCQARHPARLVGLHFFEPVPLMRVVEVIPGLRTDPAILKRAAAWVRHIGHQPVESADSPGFIANLIGRALLTEGLRIRHEGIADAQTIDRVIRDSLALRMGPFELLDLIGLDVCAANIDLIYQAFQQEPRLRPTPELALREAAGLLGRKTGGGYYPGGQAAAAVAPSDPAGLPPVWIDAADPAQHARMRDHLAGQGIVFDLVALPGPESLCLIAPLGDDATTYAVRAGLDPQRTVAVDTCFDLAAHATLMAAPVIQATMRRAALALFGARGATSWIEDSPGFIAQRVLSAIVNLACDAAQQNIAEPDAIDDVAQRALGYPLGPLAMGDQFGAGRIAAILRAMHDAYGDPRYRLSPWLRRRASLGVSLRTTAGRQALAMEV